MPWCPVPCGASTSITFTTTRHLLLRPLFSCFRETNRSREVWWGNAQTSNRQREIQGVCGFTGATHPASSVSCNRVAEMCTAGQDVRAPTPEEKQGFQRRLEVPTVTLPGLITRTARASGLIMRCGKEQEIYLRNCSSAGFLRTFPSRQSDPRFASTVGPSLSPTFAIPSWEQRA